MLCVDDRGFDVLVSKVVLDQSRVSALLRQIKAASVAQHVGMALNADACHLASTLHDGLHRIW
jgi:hypothetical protein